MRKFLGVIAGVIATMLIVTAFELVTTALSPIPQIDSGDYATLATVIGDMPLTVKLLVVAGWLAGGIGGSWVALRVSNWRWGGWIVAGIELAGSVANQFQLPHPFWMQLCAIAFPILGGAIGIRLHRKPYPGEPLLG